MSTPQKKHLRCTIPLENQFVKREEKGINICFTGPRPNQLHGYKEPARPLYSQIADFASKVILQCVERNPGSIFISGGAQGFDQLAFWAVEKAKKARPDLGIANILYIPFESQPSFWSPTGMFGQSEYRRMKRFADTVRFISPNPHPDDRRAVARALFERNHAMVKDSNLVIALLAGRSRDWENSSGGTAECVRYARSQACPVLAIEYRPDADESKFKTKILPFAQADITQLKIS